MANPCLELLGFIFSTVGLVMTVVICALPEWRTNDVEGEVIESIKRSSGLWSRVSFSKKEIFFRNFIFDF